MEFNYQEKNENGNPEKHNGSTPISGDIGTGSSWKLYKESTPTIQAHIYPWNWAIKI